MSLRDEIGDRAIDVGMNTGGNWSGAKMADALMPLVERAVREAAAVGYASGGNDATHYYSSAVVAVEFDAAIDAAGGES